MRTVSDLWRTAVAADRSLPAYLVEEDGRWNEVSWAETGRRAHQLAAGFLALGIGKGDRVAIVSRTRLEWTLADFALISIGAIVVPVYPTSSGPESVYILANSGACAAVVEDSEQLAKLAPHRAELPALEQVIVVEGEAELTFEAIESRGRQLLEQRPGAVDEVRQGIAEDDELTYIYTSGTTGPPKGCVLLHRNYYAMVEMACKVPRLFEPGDQLLLFLPLAHVFGRLVEFAGAYEGITIAFCPDQTRVAEAIAAVKPTILPSVPRVYEKVYSAVSTSFQEATGLKRKLIDWALRVGYRASAYREAGRRYPPGLALQFALADRLVFSKVKTRLGGRLRLPLSGGAPLSKEICAFFHALDIPVMEGYGLTESGTAATVNSLDCYRIGTVGQPFDGCEVRIAEDGEILIRGENVFAGYYEDEGATRDALTGDGWLRTGDVGELDADGFLTITDRKKDLIVTAGAKNISPQNIENALKSAPLVSQALVVGEGRPYLIALLTIDQAEVDRDGKSPDEVRSAVDQAVTGVNAELGRVEQIKRFTILPRDFSAEEGEITPTLKLRRRVCEKHFRDEIEALYS